jgi:uncharacterized protein YndB with AHSA1/START domain
MIKFLFFTASLCFAFNVNLLAQEAANQNNAEKINWPVEYNPLQSKFFVHNEIEINASPDTVWKILIDALKWESWYSGAKNVALTSSSDTVLQANSVFHWKTMGFNFQSVIKQYSPHTLLAWESKKKSIRAYNVWLIVPSANGCKVIVEESQNGWLTFLERTFEPHKLKKMHDVWLLALKVKSEETKVKAMK